MRTYYFKIANWLLFVLTIFFSLVGGDVLLAFILPKGLNNTIYYISYVGVLFFCIYMTRLTSFAKVKITIEDDIISIKWLEQFIFSNKSDVTISFNEISTYSKQYSAPWDWLIIKMKNGNIYRIWHFYFFAKDGYSEFISEFVSSAKKHTIVDRKRLNISPGFYQNTKQPACKSG